MTFNAGGRIRWHPGLVHGEKEPDEPAPYGSVFVRAVINQRSWRELPDR